MPKYVCPVCGWSVVQDTKPEICPLCMVEEFDVEEEDEE